MHPVFRGACGSIVFALTLLLVGSPQAARLNALTVASDPVEFSELRTKARQRFAAGAFEEAADLYASGYRRSVSNDPRAAMLCLIGLGAVRVLTFHYQGALDALLEARQIGESRHDFESLGRIWTNLSSLYLAVGDIRAARMAAERALGVAAQVPGIPYRGQLLAQVGFVYAQSGNAKDAVRYFERAVKELDNESDTDTRATILAVIGRQLLRLGDTEAAEVYLTEAFRLQKMFRGRDLRFTYFGLSELRLTQRDVRAASILIDRATTVTGKADGLAEWLVDRQRGDVRLAENRVPEAVASYGRALEEARDWREEAAPSDPSGIGTDTGLHQLYGAFIEASLRLPHPPFEEIFLAVEEDRAAALRREVRLARTSLPHAEFEYWEKLAQLRASETQLVASDTAQNRAGVQKIGFELDELEARDKIGSASLARYRRVNRFESGVALRELQTRLRPEEALLSFYQGERTSYVWGITRDRIEFHPLENVRNLADLAARFRSALPNRSAERDELGEKLYQILFDPLSEAVRAKRFWLVTADNALFEVPLAALSTRQKNRRVYLIEEHSVQRIPSAFMLASEPVVHQWSTFIGIGDGIYNSADSRWHQDRTTKTPLQLARLVASSQELRNCAHEWSAGVGSSPILLTGVSASREELEDTLNRRPSGVIHIASHILWPRDRPDEALIDLGLNRSGESEVLTREDIGRLHAPEALVIMSGCSSAAAPSVPGAGVTGMVRAWLIAGAAAVIGSRWLTPDDSGELFRSFYRSLKNDRAGGSVRAVGDAMRNAQVDMLRSGTWRSDPSYWGAFYVLGKE